jgi:hypothetical protein
MLSKDREALICDLAETYQIYDMRRFSCFYISILASGLGEDSRIRRKIEGRKFPIDTLLIAASLDRLNELCWMKTKDGSRGKNHPKSIYRMLIEDKDESAVRGFMSGEEFMKYRESFMKGGDNA